METKILCHGLPPSRAKGGYDLGVIPAPPDGLADLGNIRPSPYPKAKACWSSTEMCSPARDSEQRADQGGAGGAAISNAVGKQIGKKPPFELSKRSCREGGDTGSVPVSNRKAGMVTANDPVPMPPRLGEGEHAERAFPVSLPKIQGKNQDRIGAKRFQIKNNQNAMQPNQMGDCHGFCGGRLLFAGSISSGVGLKPYREVNGNG